MKTSKQDYLAIFLTVLLFICWCAVVFLLGNIFGLGVCGWVCFMMIPVYIVITIAYWRKASIPENDSGLVALFAYYPFIFLFMAVIMNGLYLIFGTPLFSKYMYIANIVLMAAYIIAMTMSSLHTKAVRQKTDVINVSESFRKECVQMLAALIQKEQNAELKKDLSSLKEQFDYGTFLSFSNNKKSEILSLINSLSEPTKKSQPEEAKNLISKVKSKLAE